MFAKFSTFKFFKDFPEFEFLSFYYVISLQQGQGLGKSQQGMSQALAVEKTSKRGGRIVHEDDFKKPLPNMFGESFKTPQLIADEYNDEIDAEAEGGQPDQAGGGGQEVDEYGNSLAPPSMMPPPPPGPIGAAAPKPEEAKPSITDLMKNPSKVVLCKVRYKFFH